MSSWLVCGEGNLRQREGWSGESLGDVGCEGWREKTVGMELRE